ncbi:MAG: lytic transglycosylase domain-containing protein [Acidobacteriota bacterium]|nr:lytic transglycosylase domain-containing protein [Acidobacteriota bacterium]
MRRYLIAGLIVAFACSAVGLYFFDRFWIHRYDQLIARQASIYRLDEKLVWSVIYEETYFRAWKIGAAGEVGLMQVTPTVAREWAKETGFREFEKQTAENTVEFLREPERNIQIGCWYLEKMRENYRAFPAEKAMTLAAYNAGASRVEEWSKNSDAATISERNFIEKISIGSTKSYVSAILTRYYSQSPSNKSERSPTPEN